jgi:hypothetical protein
MNEIIFNISLVILSIGFILMVIYITIQFTKKTYQPCAINNSNTGNNSKNDLYNQLNQIYDDRPSITYKKMFENPEIGFGKSDFEVNDYSEIISFYTKSNK